MSTYAIKADLLQAIVACLNGQPAGQVRGILNAIEAACVEQDAAKSTAEASVVVPTPV